MEDGKRTEPDQPEREIPRVPDQDPIVADEDAEDRADELDGSEGEWGGGGKAA